MEMILNYSCTLLYVSVKYKRKRSFYTQINERCPYEDNNILFRVPMQTAFLCFSFVIFTLNYISVGNMFIN